MGSDDLNNEKQSDYKTEKKKSVFCFEVIISLIIPKQAGIYFILVHSHSTPSHTTQNDKAQA